MIQKALDTETYWINGRQRRPTPAELKGCRTILENGFSPRVKDATARAAKNAKAGRALARMDRMAITPAWDFRGVKGLDLENLRHAVQGTVFWLTEIQTFDGMERHFAFGIVEKYHPSGEFTGLVTEEDFALLDDLWKAQKDRRFLKPLFWVAAWLVPLFGLLITGVAGVELVRWVGRGFRQDASKEESQLGD